jgi:predicted Rossmann-fold nucleotide-binding protein
MSPPKSLAVFCGASSGNSPSFIAAARSVGVAFAEANCELIYGGGQLGLMGEVARACLETKGGRVLGVIPTAVRLPPLSSFLEKLK